MRREMFHTYTRTCAFILLKRVVYERFSASIANFCQQGNYYMYFEWADCYYMYMFMLCRQQYNPVGAQLTDMTDTSLHMYVYVCSCHFYYIIYMHVSHTRIYTVNIQLTCKVIAYFTLLCV